jgi:hypothetical protein
MAPLLWLIGAEAARPGLVVQLHTPGACMRACDEQQL